MYAVLVTEIVRKSAAEWWDGVQLPLWGSFTAIRQQQLTGSCEALSVCTLLSIARIRPGGGHVGGGRHHIHPAVWLPAIPLSGQKPDRALRVHQGWRVRLPVALLGQHLTRYDFLSPYWDDAVRLLVPIIYIQC